MTSTKVEPQTWTPPSNWFVATWYRLQKDWYYVTLAWYALRLPGMVSTPKRTSLNLIDWWQTCVTSDDGPLPNRCPRGAGDHCSKRGRDAIEKYGILGWFCVLRDLQQCRKDYGETGAC